MYKFDSGASLAGSLVRVWPGEKMSKELQSCPCSDLKEDLPIQRLQNW